MKGREIILDIYMKQFYILLKVKRLANKDIILDDVIKESINLTVTNYEEMLPEIKLNEIEKNTLRNTIYYDSSFVG